MSIELTFYPTIAKKRQLKNLLVELGFKPTSHLWEWPKGSIHFHWFNQTDYLSYDGVEATVYSPDQGDTQRFGQCDWALHTRTRIWASPADLDQQNYVVRIARARFGGKFYNDSAGTNRYTKVEEDHRDAPSRGVYLAYEEIRQRLDAVRYCLPDPHPGLEKLVGTSLEPLSHVDPARVVYSALVPFGVAGIEHFFSRTFKALVQYKPNIQEQIAGHSRKVSLADALSIQDGTKSVLDIMVNWYSFQNLDSIQSAFDTWLDINVMKVLRQRKRIGRRVRFLDDELKRIIAARHELIHRFQIDTGLGKQGISDLLRSTMAVIDAFVDYLQADKGMRIRDLR